MMSSPQVERHHRCTELLVRHVLPNNQTERVSSQRRRLCGLGTLRNWLVCRPLVEKTVRQCVLDHRYGQEFRCSAASASVDTIFVLDHC